MTRFISAWALILLFCKLTSAQFVFHGTLPAAETVQTGFAIVTPTVGTGNLFVLERLGRRSEGSLFDTTVMASPVSTTTFLTINPGNLPGSRTGISIVNPNTVISTVTLTLNDLAGNTAATTSFPLNPGQQISRFVSEIFGEPIALNVSGLLSIESTVWVGAVAFLFRGPALELLPTTAQLVSGSARGTPVVPTNPSAGPSASGPIIGGSNALLFPQFATGGEWLTHISIANTSGISQTVRVDFFNTNGVLLTSVTNITLPPNGTVLVFPTAPSVF